jgi:homocysteine S-methyltransferase
LSEAPQAVEAVHTAYIESGANVITSNSYAVVPFHIGEERFAAEGQALAALAGELARRAVEASGKAVRVAGSLPPLFGSYRPDLFDAARAAELLAPLVKGLAPHVDLWLAETQSSIAEIQAVAQALAGDSKPLWLSFTLLDEVGQPPRLRSAEPVAEAVRVAAGLGAQAVLFNCSQPEVMVAALSEAADVIRGLGLAIELGVYATAFPAVDAEAKANSTLLEIRPDLGPQAYLHWAKSWVAAGANIVGGCCGIGPEHIAQLHQHLIEQELEVEA